MDSKTLSFSRRVCRLPSERFPVLTSKQNPNSKSSIPSPEVLNTPLLRPPPRPANIPLGPRSFPMNTYTMVATTRLDRRQWMNMKKKAIRRIFGKDALA